MVESFYPIVLLLLMDGFGDKHCFMLPEDYELAFDMFRSEAGRKELGELLGRRIGAVDWASFEKQVERIDRSGASVVTFYDGDYPEYLRHIPEPPPLLMIRGDVGALGGRGVAVVGTRKPSARGAQLARKLAGRLSALGIAVTSGLARGIDTAAHLGSLEGSGPAVGVMGSGLDVPYPSENAGLMDSIAAKGCLVTEQLMGMSPQRFTFPKRNRLISAFSQAVVVVEAGERSGALITARWALEQGRDVGAVPGFPGDFRSRGVNRLLKRGAFLVEDVEDILEAVPLLRSRVDGRSSVEARSRVRSGEREGKPSGGSPRERVLDAVSKEPADVDTLSENLGLAPAVLGSILTVLELEGTIARDATGCYYRKHG